MRRRLAAFTITATALGFLAVAPLASAGRDTEPKITKADVRKLRQAAERTLAAGPRKYQVEVVISTGADPPSPGTEIVPFRGEGVIDPATGATDATLDVAIDDQSPNTALTVTAPSNDVSYLMSDEFTLPPGKQWVEVPSAQLQSVAPTTSALKYASEFVGKPRVGEPSETRDGVKTTRYVVDVPLRTILESGGIPTDAATERELRRLERSRNDIAFVNLYLDHDGRILQYATFMYIPIKGSGDLELAVSGEFYDFGTEFDATPPPADQVVAADTVADQLEPFLGELEPDPLDAKSGFTGVPVAETTPTPEERLRNSVEATAAVGTTAFDGSIDVGTGDPLTFTGALTIDGRNGELTIDFGSLLLGADPMLTRAVDGTYFIELAALADIVSSAGGGELPQDVLDKEWVRADPEELGQAGVGASGSDPGAQLAMLRAMTKVEEVGVEDVRGEPTTHFSGVVNLKRALRMAPRRDRPRLEDAFESFGRQRVPVDVWLDSLDRLRRFDADVDAPSLDSTATVSAEYFDFGVAVNAEAPPSDTVISYSDFLEAVRENAAR